MDDIKCSSCGHTGKSEEGWTRCPECGHTLCHNCSKQESKEKQDLEKLRKGGSYERVTTLCPSCGYGMINL